MPKDYYNGQSTAPYQNCLYTDSLTDMPGLTRNTHAQCFMHVLATS